MDQEAQFFLYDRDTEWLPTTREPRAGDKVVSSGEAFLREHDKKSEGSSLIWMNSSRDYRNLEVDKWILEQYGQPEYEEFLNFNRISSKKVLLYKAANSNRDSFVGFIASEGNHKSGRTFFEQWPWPDHQFNSSVNASWASGRSISVYRKESDPRFDISSEIFCSGVTGSLFEFSNSATGYKPLNVYKAGITRSSVPLVNGKLFTGLQTVLLAELLHQSPELTSVPADMALATYLRIPSDDQFQSIDRAVRGALAVLGFRQINSNFGLVTNNIRHQDFVLMSKGARTLVVEAIQNAPFLTDKALLRVTTIEVSGNIIYAKLFNDAQIVAQEQFLEFLSKGNFFPYARLNSKLEQFRDVDVDSYHNLCLAQDLRPVMCFLVYVRLAIRLIVQLVCAEDSLLLNEIFKNVSELLRMQNQTKDNVDITPVVIVLEDECDESVEIKAESKSMHKCPSPCKKLYTTARLFNDHYRKCHFRESEPLLCGYLNDLTGNFCSKRYANKNKLNDHRQTHKTKKKFYCAECALTLGVRSMDVHYRSAKHLANSINLGEP